MGQKPFLVWFTGLSAAGKSTLANHLEVALHQKGYKTYLLDGDNLRIGLNRDLGFSQKDRDENIRRVGEVARLMMDAGLIVITAFISPMEKEREFLRKLIGADDFFEIHVDCPIEVCEARDPKGIYKKVRAGQIQNFTGIDSPYEVPSKLFLLVDTEKESLLESVNKIKQGLKSVLLSISNS
tara:strand:+ start:86531 stop:87076 length:546 start_codon:yes stop_codon:yes gene_type:complete